MGTGGGTYRSVVEKCSCGIYFCGTVWLLVVCRETNFCELLGDE
jgi:hypothetical protein